MTIDDPGLPLSDGLVAQVIAPSLQVGARLALHIPPPTWLQSTDLLFNNRPGGLLAPTLLHGAALAVAWITAALAAKAYERPAISPVRNRPSEPWDYAMVFLRLSQAGAFAAGLWIFATQINVYYDTGGYIQWGDSAETDARLVIAASESIADFVFEASAIVFWRLYLAYQTERLNGE